MGLCCCCFCTPVCCGVGSTVAVVGSCTPRCSIHRNKIWIGTGGVFTIAGIIFYIVLTINCWNAHVNRVILDYEMCNGTDGKLFRGSPTNGYLPPGSSPTGRRLNFRPPSDSGSCLSLKSKTCLRCQNFSYYWDPATEESNCRQPLECLQHYKPVEAISYSLSPLHYQGGPCWSMGTRGNNRSADGIGVAILLGVGVPMLIASLCRYFRLKNQPPAPAYPVQQVVQMGTIVAQPAYPVSHEGVSVPIIAPANQKPGPHEAI